MRATLRADRLAIQGGVRLAIQAEGRGGGYRSEEGCASDAAGGPASNTWGEG